MTGNPGDRWLDRRRFLGLMTTVTVSLAGCQGREAIENIVGDGTRIQNVTATGYDGTEILSPSKSDLVVTTEREPNDARNTAQPVSLRSAVTGTLEESDTDWYALEVGAGRDIALEFVRENSSGGVSIVLYGPGGDFVDMAYVNDAASGRLNASDLASGTYYVRIEMVDEATGRYRLRVLGGRRTAVPTSPDGTATSSPGTTSAGTPTPTDDAGGSSGGSGGGGGGSGGSGGGDGSSGGGGSTPTGTATSSPTETATTTPSGTQAPYGGTPHDLPGTIQAEDYDEGGEGTAYHDSDDENQGGEYRTDEGVDIQTATESEGGYNVGWIEDGEWIEYTVEVESAGTYDLLLRVASQNDNPGTITVSIAGDQLDTVDIPDTGGWQQWDTIRLSGVNISAGEQILRLDFSGGDFNLNWFAFVVPDTEAPTAPSNLSSPAHSSSTVDLEWDPSTDNVDVDHYNVYVDGSQWTESIDTTETVSGLNSNTTYDFHVTAEDAAGNESDPSNTISVTTDENDTSAEIQPYSNDPRYWEYGGTPLMLRGGSIQDNMFQWVGEGGSVDVVAELDLLQSLGGNYLRNTMSDRDGVQHGEPQSRAFVQTSDGYDLNQQNATYFDKLDQFLTMCEERGIIVSLEMFDPHDLDHARWDASPWRPANNVNYTESETILENSWDVDPSTDENPFFETVPSLQDDQTVLPFQEQFVGWVLDVTLQHGNVVYLITNELRGDPAWDEYWASFIHDYAAKDVYVGYMHSPEDATDAVNVTDYGHVDMSQASEHSGENHATIIGDAWDELGQRPMPLDNTKQYDCSNEGAAKVWRALWNGAASARYHRGPFRECNWGIGLNAKAQAHLDSMTAVFDAISVFPGSLDRHRDVEHLLSSRDSDEAWLMADPGNVYLVFFPKKGSRTGDVELDVSDVGGDVTVEWRDIEGQVWASTETLSGSPVLLETPTNGDHWVAVVTPA